MPDTYTHLRYHLIFGTKNRAPLIATESRDSLYSYLSEILSKQRAIPIALGGMPDHVHLLVGLRATHLLPDVMRELKASSSRWMKERWSVPFSWQVGYGAFTVSESNTAMVQRYILRQEEHHRRFSFQDELDNLLKRHGLQADPTFLGG
jgi:putative transposase